MNHYMEEPVILRKSKWKKPLLEDLICEDYKGIKLP